ncbi:MAG: DsbA family protein, partial [Thermodesulfobacteriota bacterium]
MKNIAIVTIVLILVGLGLNAWILAELSSIKGDVKKLSQQVSGAVEAIKKIKTAPSAPVPPSEPSEVRVSIDDDPIKGDPKASLTIIEFSDYQCPFCRRFHQEVLPAIQNEYISKGIVRYVFRDYPLAFHQQALPAALAANCAGEQEKYWEMNDFLFENPTKLDIASILSSAKSLGLNYDEFEKCVDGKKYEAEIQKDMEDAKKYGVSGTPSFFIGKTEEGKEMTASYIRG